MTPRALRLAALLVCALAACAPNPNGGGGDDTGGDDEPPVDACPCPSDGGGGGEDGGGGGGDGGGQTGCNGDSSAASQPFGNHAQSYASGTILPDHLSQSQLDGAVRAYYDRWKASFLRQGCGDGRYYVEIGLDNRLTVSEAHGFGMVIVAYMAGHDPDAKEIFDGMVAYYQDHPSEITPGLMAWAQNSSCGETDGATSATDGDLDIAYALLLADKQWSSGGDVDYAGLADALLDAIEQGEVDASGGHVNLGDWTSGDFDNTTRSSDFMPGHFASFAQITGDGTWSGVADRTYEILASIQGEYAANTGLLPDFIRDPRGDPYPAEPYFLENQADGSYGYNACRDPWRIAVDHLTNGDPRSKNLLTPLNAWIKSSTGSNPWEIRPGYGLGGNQIGGTYFDRAFVAPFGVAAMVDGANQGWLNDIFDAVVDGDLSNYYGDTIGMLSLIAMSGNWWAPEAAPCP